ncbi:hypothetical protein NBZ79_07750 [Sneathiella marina]|uniref:Uncharacterized protein n=1 Tax=Sneathiella marina TaxID=2950108 RepID=A0ABY4W749_9PROT|nr:hypothetical protein [Sneathiella marina]USG62868.1 hypothetical protein NBZ79_07750 [Sneathiella marina]
MFTILKNLNEVLNVCTVNPQREKFGTAIKARKKSVITSMFTFLNNNEDIKLRLLEQTKSLSKEFLNPGAEIIALDYPQEHFEYLAQLYIYRQSIDKAEKDTRKKIVKTTVRQYFPTKDFRTKVRDVILKYDFTIPTRNLESFTRYHCELIRMIQCFKSLSDYEDYMGDFFKDDKTAKLSALDYAAHMHNISVKVDSSIKESGVDTIFSIPKSEITSLKTYFSCLTYGLTAAQRNEFLEKYLDPQIYPHCVTATTFLIQNPTRVGQRDIILRKTDAELLRRTFVLKDKMKYPEEKDRIQNQLIKRKNARGAKELLPSVIAAIKLNCFFGSDYDNTVKFYNKLFVDQTEEDKDQSDSVHIYLTNNNLTAEKLFEILSERQKNLELTAEDKKDYKDDDDNDDEEEKTESNVLDNLLQVSAQADTLFEENLEEHALSQDIIAEQTKAEMKSKQHPDDEFDNDDNEPIEKKKKEKGSDKPTPQKKVKRKFDPDRVYSSPKKKRKKKYVKSSTSKPDPKAVQATGQEIMVSIGVLTGINRRLEELTETNDRLANLTVDNKRQKDLDLLQARAAEQRKIMGAETEADKWVLAEINDKCLACDTVLYEAGNFLKGLQKETAILQSFDDALWKLIGKEPLITGKNWGGKIQKKLAGKFETIEAHYHGRRFDPGKRVNINGKKRHLKLNEALVFYVTQHSTTKGIKYCLAIKLWHLRDPDTPLYRGHRGRRIYEIGGLVKPADSIDPISMRPTCNMAVLHVE